VHNLLSPDSSVCTAVLLCGPNGQRMKYKNQHWVTEAYLKAWCDPKTPNNGAFVWVVSKKDRRIWQQSPRSLFSDEDFYTIEPAGSERNLALEHKLKEFEDKFILLRDRKLTKRVPLSETDRYDLAVFVAAAYARTKRLKEEGKQIWREYLEMVENSPPEKAKLIKARPDYQDVVRLHKDQPLLFGMVQFVNSLAPYIYSMNCAIFETTLSPGVITSDNPCIWMDPEMVNPAYPFKYYGLGSPTLNVIFPLSPRQYVSFAQKGPDGYFDLGSKPETERELVDSMNWLATQMCDERIVVSEKVVKDQWFEERPGGDLET
jgi:hypothetical protein